MSGNPISEAIDYYGTVILDGALGTELQARGCDLADKLWSAKVLIESPELIYQVHYDYLAAGARCISTCSYQATPQGFALRGLDEAKSIALIKLSVSLAKRAKDDYLQSTGLKEPLLVGGSIGPYGAFLANGSEYRGDYELPEKEMIAFHRARLQALVEAGVDVLAVETIPSFAEIKALARLLTEYPNTVAWFSFMLRDAQSIRDGTPLTEVASYLNDFPQIVAVGLNCVGIELVTGALKNLKSGTVKPLLVYPNSGEQYDEVTKTWHSTPSSLKIHEKVDEWQQAGARLIGGCCRTSPKDITAIFDRVKAQQNA